MLQNRHLEMSESSQVITGAPLSGSELEVAGHKIELIHNQMEQWMATATRDARKKVPLGELFKSAPIGAGCEAVCAWECPEIARRSFVD